MDYIEIDSIQTKQKFTLEEIVGMINENKLIIAELQRELDIERVKEIKEFQKTFLEKENTFLLLGDLIVVSSNNKLILIDGHHRLTALKELYLLKPDYSIILNIINITKNLTIEDLFLLINKAVPVPDYVKICVNNKQNKIILDKFGEEFYKCFNKYISKSPSCRRPNIYLSNLLDKMIKNNLLNYFSDGDKLFEFICYVNDKLKDKDLKIKRLSEEKASKYKIIPLYLSADIDDEYFSECNIQEFEKSHKKLQTDTKYKIKWRIPPRKTVFMKIYKDNLEGLCPCCQSVKIRIDDFEIGHIVSKKNGGSSALSNLMPICRYCNRNMGSINMHDYVKEFYSRTL